MNRLRKNQAGFSAVEIGLIIVIAAFVGFVGWFVHRAAQNSDKVLSSGTSQQVRSGSQDSSASAGSTSAAALSTDLNNITASDTQSSQDLSSSTNSLNDQSTFTAIPQ